MTQRTWQIWSFAFVFAIRYWLLGRKWAYGKGGMTEAKVTQRKGKLAVWLREGLVKLGPTFIKVRLSMRMPHLYVLQLVCIAPTSLWPVSCLRAQRHVMLRADRTAILHTS